MIAWIRWIAGLFLLVLSCWIICLNAWVFWKGYIQRKKAASWIPLIGGIFGMIAVLVLPVFWIKTWWWVPLLIDWGSLPGLLYTLIWFAVSSRKKG